MTISRFRVRLKKEKSGTFRLLNPGEEIEAHDIVLHDCFWEAPSEPNIGQPCHHKETILRLEFTK